MNLMAMAARGLSLLPPPLRSGSAFARVPVTHNSSSFCVGIGVVRYTHMASDSEAPAKVHRRILGSPGLHQGPACFDALSAKLVERAGFKYCCTGGFSISAARLGLPDAGLISFGEMMDQGRQISQAVSIPVIGDGDNGYGNAMNVKKTTREFIRAGFAGIILKD